MPIGKQSPHGDSTSSETSSSRTTPEIDQEERKNQSKEFTKGATNHSNANGEPEKTPPFIHPDINAHYNEAINLQPMDADQYRITDLYGDKIEMDWDQFYKSFDTLKKTTADEIYQKHPELSALNLDKLRFKQRICHSNYYDWALLEGLKFIDVYPNPDIPGILYTVTHINKFYPYDHTATVKHIEYNFDEFLQKAKFTKNTDKSTFKLTKIGNSLILAQKPTKPLMLQVTYSVANSVGDLQALSTHLTGYNYSLIGGTAVLPKSDSGIMHSFQCVIDWHSEYCPLPPLNHESGSTVQVLNQ